MFENGFARKQIRRNRGEREKNPTILCGEDTEPYMRVQFRGDGKRSRPFPCHHRESFASHRGRQNTGSPDSLCQEHPFFLCRFSAPLSGSKSSGNSSGSSAAISLRRDAAVALKHEIDTSCCEVSLADTDDGLGSILRRGVIPPPLLASVPPTKRHVNYCFREIVLAISFDCMTLSAGYVFSGVDAIGPKTIAGMQLITKSPSHSTTLPTYSRRRS